MVFSRVMFGKKALATWDDLDAAPAKTPARFCRIRVNPVEVIVVVMIVGVLVALLLPTGDHDLAHRYPTPAPSAGLGFTALAGEYCLGVHRGGRGWVVSILPDGRYSMMWSCCTGVGYRESGSVKRIGEYLVLSSTVETESRFARVFRPVKWGSRTYLIPPEKFGEFIDTIIKGDEPRFGPGRFYVLGLDDQVSGMPVLPNKWATELRKKLVIGTIVEVKERGRAKINIGSADGVVAGSVLTIQGRDRFSSRQIRAVTVDERSCDVVVINPREPEAPLMVGCNVATERMTKLSARP